MSKTVKRTFVVLAIFAVMLAVLTGFATKSFAVKAEPAGATDLVYTGEPQALIADPGTPDFGHVIMYSLGGYCPSWTCDPNAIVATEAGTYTVCWYEGHYYNPDQYNCFTVEIAKQSIPVPTAEEGLVYDGTEKIGVSEGDGYTVICNKKTDVGKYVAIAALTDCRNTQWSDGTFCPKYIEWSIAKKNIDIPTAETGLVYNGEERTGVPAGEGYNIEGNTGKNAGDYGATASLADPENTQWSDGTIEDKTIDWSIAKATIVITPKEGQSKIYGEADPEAFEYDAEGLFGEDTITGALGREEGENVGEYGYINELDAGRNYSIEMCEEPATFEIKPAQVTVTVEDKTKVEGETDPEFTAKAEGLVGEDELEYTFTREKGETAGKYAITAEVKDNPNYVVTVVDGTLTITEKPAKPATPGTGIDATESGFIAGASLLALAVIGAFAVVAKKRSVK